MKIRESEIRLRVQVKFRGSIDLRIGTSTRNSKVDMNISGPEVNLDIRLQRMKNEEEEEDGKKFERSELFYPDS